MRKQCKQTVPSSDEMVSQHRLAKMLCITQQAVQKMTRVKDWPFGGSPWPMAITPLIHDWRERRRRERDGEVDEALGEAIVERATGQPVDVFIERIAESFGYK